MNVVFMSNNEGIALNGLDTFLISILKSVTEYRKIISGKLTPFPEGIAKIFFISFTASFLR